MPKRKLELISMRNMKYLKDCPKLYKQIRSKIGRKKISFSKIIDLLDCHKFQLEEEYEYLGKMHIGCRYDVYIIPNNISIIYEIFPKDIANIINIYAMSYIYLYGNPLYHPDKLQKTCDILKGMKVFDDYRDLINYLNSITDYRMIRNTTEFAEFLHNIPNKK